MRDKPPFASPTDSEIPKRGDNDYVGAASETICPDAYGLEVVYQGGICTDLDLALYEAIGRDSNDEGCNLHTQRRDMFWRCTSIEEALKYRVTLMLDIERHPDFASMAARRTLCFAVKTEEEHWDAKLAALDCPRALQSTDPSTPATPNTEKNQAQPTGEPKL